MRFFALVGLVVAFLSPLCALEEGETTPLLPSLPLSKPVTMGALIWLQILESHRDEAELTGNRAMMDALAAETKATLGGKYGLAKRLATPDEQRIMVASIQRHCRLFPYGAGDMEAYLAYIPRPARERTLRADPTLSAHLGAILAVIAMTNTCLQSPTQATAWTQWQQEGTEPDEGFYKAALEEAQTQCMYNVWEHLKTPYERAFHGNPSLKQIAFEGFTFLPPRIDFKELMDELMVGEGHYQGWEVHGLTSAARWPLAEGGNLAAVQSAIYMDCEGNNGFFEPLLSRAVCLSPSTPRVFSYLDSSHYDGSTWAVELMLSYKLHQGHASELLNLVLTRKGPPAKPTLFKVMPFKEKKHVYKHFTDYKRNSYLLDPAEFLMLMLKAYDFDILEAGYELARYYSHHTSRKGLPPGLPTGVEDSLTYHHYLAALYKQSADKGMKRIYGCGFHFYDLGLKLGSSLRSKESYIPIEYVQYEFKDLKHITEISGFPQALEHAGDRCLKMLGHYYANKSHGYEVLHCLFQACHYFKREGDKCHVELEKILRVLHKAWKVQTYLDETSWGLNAESMRQLRELHEFMDVIALDKKCKLFLQGYKGAFPIMALFFRKDINPY